MTCHRCFGFLAIALVSSVSAVSQAEPAAKAPGTAAVARAKTEAVRVSTVTIPRNVNERTRSMLRSAVEQNLSASDIEGHEKYAVAVSLLQLRRYVGPDDNEPKTVCIVDLALHDENGVLVGSVRGRASVAHAEARDAVDAAAHSAVSRIPEALRLVEQSRASSKALAHR
jgi:hypothetical protein